MQPFITPFLILSLLVAQFPVARSTAAQRETVQVMVTSTPGEADVYVDGRRVGATPYAGWFEPGAYGIRVVRDGYAPWAQTVSLTDDMRLTLTLSPQRAPRDRSWIWKTVGAVIAVGAVAAAGVIINDRISTHRGGPR